VTDAGRELPQRAISALLWVAAFCFATGIFLSATQLLRGLPPTPHVAVGRVTVENASKTRDYATAALFFALVPVLTIGFYRVGGRMNESLRAAVHDEGKRNLISLLFVSPFFLAPFLYLTTFKWGWPVLIPVVLSQLIPRAVIAFEEKLWLRRLLSPELAPFHALVLSEAFAWILFRYVATVKRIAHIPTLFLEVVFVFLFLFIFWAAFLLIARLATFAIGIELEEAFKRIAVAGLPLVALPVLVVIYVPARLAIAVTLIAVLIAITVAFFTKTSESSSRIRAVTVYAVIPLLLYCLSYASLASFNQWVDLFHRGESLGPASDYLRGKIPYRDVFILHGLMHDGMLDAWLMELFGRSAEVSMARFAIFGSLASPALWYLAMALFNSIPLAIVVMFFGSLTTIDNERILFEIATLTLLVAGLRGRARPLLVFLAGIPAGIALFYSFDIGLYCVGGGVLFLLFQKPRWVAAAFIAGVAAGAAPFVIYLAFRGALGAFVENSFIVIPRIIDAVWSVPFPDLTSQFRQDLSLRTISDFLFSERVRFILNPLVIGIAMIVLLHGAIRKRRHPLDTALLALTSFALLTQRSALGRVDFSHQTFSAFLIGPIILVLILRLIDSVRESWQSRDRTVQAFLVGAGALAFAAFFTAMWIPDILNLRLNDLIGYGPRTTKTIRDPLAREIEDRIGSVGFHVAELSPPGSPIFDFSNQPAFYFFFDRPNPTRFYQIPIMSPREFQRQAIVDLERAKPPLVIRRSPQDFDIFDGIDNVVRAQAVARYIDDHYNYVRTVTGVELWKRKAKTSPANVELYLREIRVPTVKELDVIGRRATLVFPSVGSVPGANDSFWRSDLTLHNPWDQPMRLGLRYVSGSARLDRTVVLNPGRSMRWEDVVKTLFGAPDSRGVLWLHFRGDRGPVARVKTYDVSRASSGTVDRPLGSADSATSGSGLADLVIVGLPGGDQSSRRINAGVVNVGRIPATFRVTVRTRDGVQVGRAVEEGLPEGESAFINNVEVATGATIDDTATVHITMIAGTGVGYASVVSTEGYTQSIPAVPAPKP